jgi:hypothetical protein
MSAHAHLALLRCVARMYKRDVHRALRLSRVLFRLEATRHNVGGRDVRRGHQPARDLRLRRGLAHSFGRAVLTSLPSPSVTAGPRLPTRAPFA